MGSATPLSNAITMPNDPVSPPQVNGIHYHDDQTMSINHSGRPTILHLGIPIRHNHKIHERLKAQFDIIHVSGADLERPAFMNHLRARTWGDVAAIMRPFWKSGNEMAPWNAELISLLPKSVKVMASAGAGFDWVDDRCLAENGIIYCNGAHASNESVADMALYHIISVFRHMTASSLAARSGSATDWLAAHNDLPAKSHNPRGHTLGIVGLGNIGFAIAVKVKAALGMTIIYHDIIRKPYDHNDNIAATFYSDLDAMLPLCDCLLIATPGGPEILTARTLSLLPRGSRVVNIARGSLVDETALADALDSGHIDAAGLDVFKDEPNINKRLAAMPNVEMTCHTGGGSVETNIGFERLSMENCEAVLRGEEPRTAVNTRWLRPKKDLVVTRETPMMQPAVDDAAAIFGGQKGGQNHNRQAEPIQQPLDTVALSDPAPIPTSEPTPATTALPAVDTQVPSVSTTRTPDGNDTVANPSLSASIDSAVSMSMDVDETRRPLPSGSSSMLLQHRETEPVGVGEGK